MKMVHLIEGPIGAGKSTYAHLLGAELKSTPLILDRWMATLYRPDRTETDFWGWYAERKERCIDQIWDLAQGMLAYHDDVILELGLLSREARWNFAQRLFHADVGTYWHVLDLDEGERWRRVEERNRASTTTHVMDVPRALFELASSLWQRPVPSEGLPGEILEIDYSKQPQLPSVPKCPGPTALRLDQLEEASDLCLRSKAHWGYGGAFMEACRGELTLTADDLEAEGAAVIKFKRRLVGLVQVTHEADGWYLDKLFVDPDYMGQGLGKRLFYWALAKARSIGIPELFIVSDPGAEQFYLRSGCSVVGNVPSSIEANRHLKKFKTITSHEP